MQRRLLCWSYKWNDKMQWFRFQMLHINILDLSDVSAPPLAASACASPPDRSVHLCPASYVVQRRLLCWSYKWNDNIPNDNMQWCGFHMLHIDIHDLSDVSRRRGGRCNRSRRRRCNRLGPMLP